MADKNGTRQVIFFLTQRIVFDELLLPIFLRRHSIIFSELLVKQRAGVEAGGINDFLYGEVAVDQPACGFGDAELLDVVFPHHQDELSYVASPSN